MTLLPTYPYPQGVCYPELGFQVLHHEDIASHYATATAIRTTVIGTYPTFTTAQAAALRALEMAIDRFVAAGHQVTAYKEIDLVMRGMMTAKGQNGRMKPVSEFVIRPVEVWDEIWLPRMGGEEEAALFNISGMSKPKPIVKLPPAPTRPIRLASTCYDRYRKLSGPDSPQEAQLSWVQTRVPFFRKRDDWPFRSSSDPPYRFEMSFVRPLPPRHPWPVLEIIKPQPDELSENPGMPGSREGSEPQHIEQMKGIRSDSGFNEGYASSQPRTGKKTGKPKANRQPRRNRTGKTKRHGRVYGNELGGGKDIGPIWGGRRHSSPDRW